MLSLFYQHSKLSIPVRLHAEDSGKSAERPREIRVIKVGLAIREDHQKERNDQITITSHLGHLFVVGTKRRSP